MRRAVALSTLVLLLFVIIIPIGSNAQRPPQNRVQVLSSFPNQNKIIYVPVNSSDRTVYPDWQISLFGSGSFNFSAIGNVVESGNVVNSFSFTYNFSVPSGTTINATLIFEGVTYTFSEKIVDSLSTNNLQYVSILSSYKGQNQYLTVLPGEQGALMYPDWNITLFSSSTQSYSIYENSQKEYAGTFSGSKYFSLNISSSTVSVIIGIGGTIYKFNNEAIALIPVEKYYGPKPPPLVYTLSQYEDGIMKAFIASFFGLTISILMVRKYVLEKEKREVVVE